MGIRKTGQRLSTKTDLNILPEICEEGTAEEEMAVLRMLPCGGTATVESRQLNNIMPDDLTKTGRADDTRINIHQDHELRYWSQKLGVTPDQIKEAVRAVGPMVKDVKRHLGIYT
jgi:hypothetical protein